MKRFNLRILEIFCCYGGSARRSASAQFGVPVRSAGAADFSTTPQRRNPRRSLSTVNHKKPIVKAMLKLASPVWSLVSSRHFIGLPIIGSEEMPWWAFDPASAKIAG
ncbi:hypothetical protein [Agrobacterium fabrum]|uniref:hypothetical protein n=1 Tax=Agrobacterium fabrum TaxID=1176649 RepID=UPI003B9F2033